MTPEPKTTDVYERWILGMKQVLGYLENRAKDSADFAPEAERTRLFIAAAERRSGEELVELITRPMPDHYGGTGWQYVAQVAKELALLLGMELPSDRGTRR